MYDNYTLKLLHNNSILKYFDLRNVDTKNKKKRFIVYMTTFESYGSSSDYFLLLPF